MDLLGSYRNGNYMVRIYDDGTKIRETEDDEFVPAFAESIDFKITDYCDKGCKMCHEGSSVNGRHGDILDQKLIDSFHPYQELAIGGGDPTSHPDLIPFLQELKKRHVIANITVNQTHFEKKQDLIRYLVDEKLIHGLGVSLVDPNDGFISLIQEYPNAVIHTINGLLTPGMIDRMSDKGLKILILGYKQFRRGSTYYDREFPIINTNQKWLENNLFEIVPHFSVVSFDNLAINQLNLKEKMDSDAWNEFYAGDDGEFTFYIDMVNKKFAKNSVTPLKERYDLLDSVDEMFKELSA